MKGLLAKKIGMTSYSCPKSGQILPITLLEAPPATVIQVKTQEKDGYSATVLGAFPQKAKDKNNKFKLIREIPLEQNEETEIKKGDTVNLESIKEIKKVKVSGVSKGRGFAGVIARYGFSRGPETHGSHHHREPGSVGMCAKPGRIMKGKKMPGRAGNDRTTLRSATVIHIGLDDNLIALKGAVPGAKNSYVIIREK